MKSLQISLLIFSASICALSCTVGPRAIEYDQDQCHACKMTISDRRFGCELITQKGKIFVFDAIECMIPEVIKNEKEYYSYILVTDYDHPGDFLNADEAVYLISPDRPSPMGGNISAYKSSKALDTLSPLPSGKTYNWQNIVDKYKDSQ